MLHASFQRSKLFWQHEKRHVPKCVRPLASSVSLCRSCSVWNATRSSINSPITNTLLINQQCHWSNLSWAAAAATSGTDRKADHQDSPPASWHATVIAWVQGGGRGGQMWERHAQVRDGLDWVSGGGGGDGCRGLRAAQSSQALQGDGSYGGWGHLAGPHLGLHVVSVAAGNRWRWGGAMIRKTNKTKQKIFYSTVATSVSCTGWFGPVHTFFTLWLKLFQRGIKHIVTDKEMGTK